MTRLQKHFENYPLKGETFNHYRPARYFSEHQKTLEGKINDATLERFEKVFEALNKVIGQ